MKNTIYLVISLTVLALLTVGATYAFYTSSASSTSSEISSSNFEVIYNDNPNSGSEINGNINVISKKEEGALETSVNIRMGEGSVDAKANLYINVEEITENLEIEGLIWEVYGYRNSNLTYSNTGNFSGVETGDVVNIVNDYLLTEDDTVFTIYLWLDGNKTDSSVVGGKFRGKIGANTEFFTAELS